MTWIIAYDVSDDRRRARLLKRLKQFGLPVQRSVFLVEGSRAVVQRLTDTLAGCLDSATDQLCAWPLKQEWSRDQLCYPAGSAPHAERFVIA